jgi:hypothetical protein
MGERGQARVAIGIAALLAAAPRMAPAAEATPAPPAAELDATDSSDVLRLFGLRKGPVRAPQILHPMVIALPTFTVNPSVGVAVGLGANAAMAFGEPEHTTVSSASGSVMYTTNQQLLVSLKSVVLTARNDWELLGDWRFYDYAEPTYGLGTTWPTPASGGLVLNGMDTASLPGAQPLFFRYVKLHETVFRRVKGAAYFGVGYHLDHYSDVVDESLDLAGSPPAVTSHYAYSRITGFDPSGYTLSGLSLNGLRETRDHTLDPHEGVYLQVSWRLDPEWLGSSKASSMLHVEFRTYVGVEARRPRHLVAIWAFADVVTSGKVPYLTLPAIGYDTRGRSGRGYAAGRFRGDALAYGEVEYRFPLMRSGLLGGVLFANVTAASRPPVDEPSLGVQIPGSSLLDSPRPGGGGGLRVMVDRRARMNLAVDYAVGAGGSSGVYLALGEAF